MKRFLVSMVLVLAISLGYFTEVQAEGCVIHEPDEGEEITFDDPVYWGYGSQMTHYKRVTFTATCKYCHNLYTDDQTSLEPHDFYLYDNLGHQDGYHKYRIYCRQCNENFIVTLICDNRDGHSTPWSYPGDELLLK